MPASLPSLIFDADRLQELERTGLLEDETVENFDRLTRRAVEAVDADAGYVSLLSDEGQFLRGCTGLPEPLASERETPLEHSICAYTLDRTDPLILDDVVAHPDFSDHPAVEAYGIRSYVGVPLITHGDEVVGTFCVVGWEPREWSPGEVEAVRDFAKAAETEVRLRRELSRRRELERESRDREAAFRALVENVTDVVTVLDEQGTIVFQSPSVTELLGYEPGELLGDPVWEYIHPEDRDRIMAAMGEAVGDPGHRPQEEFRFRDSDGSWRVLESRGRVLPADSDLGAFIGVSRDVTERREMEERLRLLATAVENAESAVVITGPRLEKPGPEIRYVNEAMCEMTGYAEEELVGNTPRLLQGQETDREVLARLRVRLRSGEPVEDETVNYRKDGTPYHVRWKITPLYGEDGAVSHFVSVQEDITEQVRREEILEEKVLERTRELDRSQSEALARLARAAEYRDDETGKHTQRVGVVASVLARGLGEDAPWIERIREAAPLHDVGKIGIPDRILLKPGQLTDQEYETMKRHAEIGANLLAGGKSDLFHMAERIARSHHERWDGGGYPAGLAEEEIPLAARIVTVADAFDAMIHDRPYRDALSVDQAVGELRAGAGEQFDPRLVETFLDRRGELLAALRETDPESALAG